MNERCFVGSSFCAVVLTARVLVEVVVLLAGKVAARRMPNTGGLPEGRGKVSDGGIVAGPRAWALSDGFDCDASTERAMGLWVFSWI